MIDEYRAKYKVISAQLRGGQLAVRIFSEESPGDDFAAASPVLEDVYFNTIASKMDVFVS